MQQSQIERANQGRKRRMRLLLGIMILFFIWAGFTVFHQQKLISESKKKLAEAQQQAKQLNQEKADLEKKVLKLQDKEYVAELARKNFLWTGKGEVLFVTPDSTQGKK